MGLLLWKGNMKQKIMDYLDEIYGGIFIVIYLQKFVMCFESVK